MAADLVSSATSDRLIETDWNKNIEICETVARDHKQARDVVKAIKKRIGSKHPNTQLYSVMLLEMLMNNVGEPVHRQVVDTGILPVLVKIVKKKSDLPVRERIFLLLDAAQTSLGGASGRFPQYYHAFYELVNAGVKFPDRRPPDIPKPHHRPDTNMRKPSEKVSFAPISERNLHIEQEIVRGSSILQKAGTAMEVLNDVLDAVDTQNPEGAKDEITLDLVEQCSFHKQRVMHLAINSRDEKTVTGAVEVNEQLERVLQRHYALLAGRTESMSNHLNHVQASVDEEDEQLFRSRIRKGKACVRPEDDDPEIDRKLGLLGCSVPAEILHRPLIRPLAQEAQKKIVQPLPLESKQETPADKLIASIPPPPAKHVEREKFFQEHKPDGLMDVRNLSLHSRHASSSRSGSIDFSE